MVRKGMNHIGYALPTVMREIEVRRAKYILLNEDKHDHEDIAWAQTILHSRPVELPGIDDPGF